MSHSSVILIQQIGKREGKSCLKAIITTIYKKGVKSDLGLTSVIAKVMESLTRDEFLSHLFWHDVLDCQHGFVPSRNCIMQLLLCLGDWTLMRENNQTYTLICQSLLFLSLMNGY